MARVSVPPNQNLPINEQTANYTLVGTDVGALIEMNSGSALTLTVPDDAAADIPVGAQVLLRQKGGGQVTVAAGLGATLDLANGEATTRAQNSLAALIKVGTDTWVLSGDLTA